MSSGPPTAHAPDPAALSVRMHVARRVAAEAGSILLRHLGTLGGYEQKRSSIDLVTVADRESEAFIAGALRARFPEDSLCLEEADGREGIGARRAELDAASFAWCVDPLDGTTSFVHGYPAFAVSIGLLHHGRPVLGVVHAPARRETFAGGVGIPATKDHHPITVSSTRSLDRALLGTGFPYDRRQRVDEILAVIRRALLVCHDLRRSGSAALDLCDVAAGRLDGFFEQTLAPWDLTAGHAIIEAAGGTLSSYRGAPHDVFAGDTVASNALIHAELIQLVAT